MYIWSIEVSRSIHEGKWLAIKYNNAKSEETSFWCAIKDINPETRVMLVDVYNTEIEPHYDRDYRINFDRIKTASVIEGSYFPKQEVLIEKINTNLEDFLFLEYNKFEVKLLNYYLECYNQDNDPSSTQYTMIDGIDVDSFGSDLTIKLDEDSFNKVIQTLRNQLSLKVRKNTIYEKLVFNYLSIHSKSKGTIPIAYYDVFIDIIEKTLVRGSSLEFSPKTIIFDQNNKVFLNDYIEVDYEFFKSNFIKYETEFVNNIHESLSRDEQIDQRPYFMKIISKFNLSIQSEIDDISEKCKMDELSYPLQALFGMKVQSKRGQKRSILIDSDKINTNQLRAIYNAINQNILYVQGPPGTGKTVSIANMIHSSLFNNDTVLLASNNNEAIDNVFRRIETLKSNGVAIRYPYLRLGSDVHLSEAIDKIEAHYSFYKEFQPLFDLKETLRALRTQIMSSMKNVVDLIDLFEKKLETEEKIKTLNDLRSMIENDEKLDSTIKARNYIDLEAQIQKYTQELPTDDIDEKHLSEFRYDDKLSIQYLELLSHSFGNNLLKVKNRSLIDVVNMKDKKERVKAFKTFLKSEEGFETITDCFPIIASTNISTLKIGTSKSQFNLLIMEEASQCNIVPSLIPMNRSRRACFVGDPQQLQPVVTLSDEKNRLLMNLYKVFEVYSYKNNSIMNLLLNIDSSSKFILLKKHYRCAKKIIDFSNMKYYAKQLEIETAESLTEPLKLIDVKQSTARTKNSSISEVNEILKEIKNTDKNQNVSVITPFKNQVKLIKSALDENNYGHIKVNTIHGFQGQESDKIIFSSAITESTTQGAFDWVKNNKELINVTSTRPRESLVVLADMAQVKRLSNSEMNDYYEFLTYMNLNGDYEVRLQDENEFKSKVDGFKIFNSESETEFIRTIAQLKSTNHKFNFLPKSRISDILNLIKIKEKDRDLFHYAIKAHFDFVLLDYLNRPLLVVEVCGYEHLSDPITMANDLKKVKICIEHNMKIIPIFNQDVRRYNEIKSVLLNSLKA